mgnify:CR=1 FL=1
MKAKYSNALWKNVSLSLTESSGNAFISHFGHLLSCFCLSSLASLFFSSSSYQFPSHWSCYHLRWKYTKTSKLQESNQGSDTYIANKDVDELVANATNSIIEKTFGDDLNGEENTGDDKATESWTEDNKDQEGNRKYQLN